MQEYTDVMLQKLEFCKGCNKWWHLTDGKTCEPCKTRDKTIYKKTIVFCKHDGCKFQKSPENEFCGKHQLDIFSMETCHIGKRTCYNVIRGCRSQLDQEYKYSKCEPCLEKDREKDKKRRTPKTAMPETKTCSLCKTVFDMSHFVGERHIVVTKTCKTCRDKGKKNDKRRDNEHRNAVARINDRKQERKQVKTQWVKDHPEKIKEIQSRSREIRRKNMQNVFYNYQKSAARRNLDFQITYEQYVELVKHPCYYCGIVDESKQFNGIDRQDANIGYILSNCVSCCTTCNMMKGTHDDTTFIKIVQHITLYVSNGVKLYPDVFRDHNTVCYTNYKNRRKENRNIEFDKHVFLEITDNACYLCGKVPTNTHKNGIDRFDNEIGYKVENCRPCCGDCNHMKRTMQYTDFINQLVKIQTYKVNS